ncbi:Dbl homology domain-containing protein, partial [Fennellomyces sp. T-0311]
DDHFDIIDSLDYDDVDDGLIDHEMVHRRREQLIQQLLTSEQAYLESLEVVCRVFIEPLRKDVKQSSFSFLGMKKMICTEREARWLFGNLEDILQVHREILASLEERYVVHCIPNVAVTTYERLTRYQPFKKFIDNAHKDPLLKGATLLSLLQTPAGCINRYRQLMTTFADVTSPMHPDYVQLFQCKQRMLSIAEEMKARIDDADNVDQVLMIHQALVGAPFGVKAQRRLVLQSSMSLSGEERIYILFSDILVFVRPKQEANRTLLQFKGMVALERARLRLVERFSIEITSPFQGVDTLNTTFMGSSQAHVLQAENDEDRDRWLERLQTVIA